MKKRIWMAGLAIALLMLVAQVYADGGRAEPPGGLLERLGAGIASLQQRFEEWRRAPYEKIEREFDTRHSALQHRLRTLEAQLDLQRMELSNVELTPGPMGPMGPQGPAGPRGRQGLPGNLQLAGESCSAGEAVAGFDALGNMLCATIQAVAGPTMVASVDCSGNLTATGDLRRCDLRQQRMAGRDLSFATLVKADLRGASLQETDLRGADLRNVELTGSDLTNVNMQAANLTFGRLGSVRVEGGDWSGAVLRRAELSLSQLHRVQMQGADLSDASMILTQTYGTNLARANLSGADFRQAVFQDSSLLLATTSTSLDQARLINTICPDGSNSSDNGNSCIGHTIR